MKKLLYHQGKTQSMSAWARELGLTIGSFINRCKRYYPNRPDLVFSEFYLDTNGKITDNPIRYYLVKDIVKEIKDNQDYCIPFKLVVSKLKHSDAHRLAFLVVFDNGEYEILDKEKEKVKVSRTILDNIRVTTYEKDITSFI